MKAALTSTQQGVKAMHSIIQQQHHTSPWAAPWAASITPLATAANAMHNTTRRSVQSHPKSHQPAVSATAAAAASAAAAATNAAAVAAKRENAFQPPEAELAATAGVSAAYYTVNGVHVSVAGDRKQLKTSY